jgi:predicted ATPase/class 3 adenylate cyclase
MLAVVGTVAGGMREGPSLPTGTVTFLFTDIEGSTRMLDRLGTEYPAILETHQALLRRAFSAHGGVEIATEGDSFFVVFPSAPEAVAAALEGQRALAENRWPDQATVRVRMGLHTGEGILGADNYVGVDVHRAARIAATGHGGQVVASTATVSLVERAAPEGVAFVDLGKHRLKDLPHPEHLYQVAAPGLGEEFPALRSMDARPNNLPTQLTSFVGRVAEIEEVKSLLGQTRFLTLTGPGGTGKTRLSLQVASDLLSSFVDGAFFVALAPITDPALVAPTIAASLGLRETSKHEPMDSVIDYLREKSLLLVMDNFEQVLAAADVVGQLLTSTEAVKVLATSREPLGIHGEREYPVPPLGLPDPARLPPLEGLSQYAAVELFIERAEGVKPGFTVTKENAPAIAEISARLDGLPLAIELAAARVKVLTPEAILGRLGHSLTLLTGGARDLPARQQTLQDAIAWSYDLLDEPERRLFARLAVFVGGFSLEAAEAICNPDGELGLDTLDGVASLTNKSLLRPMDAEAGEQRFFMLETIREYAVDRLADDPGGEALRDRHADFFLDEAGRALPELTGADQIHWLESLSLEHDNFRSALGWLRARGDAERAQRLAGTLWRFWQMRGHLREGLERLTSILDMAGARDHPEARAAALEGAGGLAYWMGLPSAKGFYEECLAIRRGLPDRAALAEAMYNLSFTDVFTRKSGDRRIEEARQLLDESLAIFRELGDERGIAKALWGLGDVLYEEGNVEAAERPMREALAMHRQQGDRFGVTWDLFLLGLDLIKLDRIEEARGALEESLSILGEARDISGIPLVLAGLSRVSMIEGRKERAVRLAGAAAAIEEEHGGGLAAINEAVEEWESQRRAVTSEEEYERLWAEGQAMSIEEAIGYGLEAASARPDVS